MPQRRRLARAAICTAAATAGLALATPAWAVATSVPLNPAHVDSTAATFPGKDCNDDRFDSLPAGYDGWHFVLPQGKPSSSFESLTLTFSNGSTAVTVQVPDSTDAYPDYFYSAGGKQMHAYLFTPAGWKLTGGSAEVTNAVDKFNLSHTCAGTIATQSPSPTPSTSVSPTTSVSPSKSVSPSDSTTSTGSGSPSASTGGNGGSDTEGGLPLTGVATTSIALGGVALIGGGALLMMRRRRDRITFTS
ncbi:LPXTG-motif cell wall anchor domain-containing protein [Micromonospora coriariae]|uniref:LPXTG-motif cell wall anchor domain-containing protein n=1 Tax=Micromonospora coriariae TaxID=285665 RepID=A0A1C4UNR4_9ACTN|nr:LPXTG cell wall anchor domain-containing protein [Micromonospora coriariae]SCE73315.1 LPXTG-motif cell wall anchor domain-containing protein [Micromonospora coriariae]